MRSNNRKGTRGPDDLRSNRTITWTLAPDLADALANVWASAYPGLPLATFFTEIAKIGMSAVPTETYILSGRRQALLEARRDFYAQLENAFTNMAKDAQERVNNAKISLAEERAVAEHDARTQIEQAAQVLAANTATGG